MPPNLSSPLTTSSSSSLFPSQTIHDRSSTFLAIFSPTLPPSTLSSLPAVASATHRITAWRRPSPQQTIPSSSSAPAKLFTTGHSDDGETSAGIRAERILIAENVEGAVVVGRWFGGVMLGPVRFQHIENVAREAVRAWKGVKGRAEEESAEKRRLVRVLAERDGSVLVLRGLLAEKMGGGRGKGGGKEEEKVEAAGLLVKTPENEKVVKVDYSAMELSTLKRLEKARDATIAWVLKQIDEVEARQRTKKRKASVEDAHAEDGKGKKAKTDGGKDMGD